MTLAYNFICSRICKHDLEHLSKRLTFATLLSLVMQSAYNSLNFKIQVKLAKISVYFCSVHVLLRACFTDDCTSGQILVEGVEDLKLKLPSCVAGNIISLITIMQRTHCHADVSLSLPHQRMHIFGHRIASGCSGGSVSVRRRLRRSTLGPDFQLKH